MKWWNVKGQLVSIDQSQINVIALDPQIFSVGINVREKTQFIRKQTLDYGRKRLGMSSVM